MTENSSVLILGDVTESNSVMKCSLFSLEYRIDLLLKKMLRSTSAVSVGFLSFFKNAISRSQGNFSEVRES